MTTTLETMAYVVIPSLQVRDFNAESNQYVVGIPAMTGFTGFGHGVERELMDTVSGGQSDLNKTQYDAATGMASTNLSGDLGNTGGPSTWDQLLGGVNSANDAGLFNKGFWNFGG